jgi:hypothetical protein
MERLYFPTTCIISLLYTMTDGATAELGLVGNDGIVGIALIMGGNPVPNRAMAQVAGDAFSAPAPVLLEEFRRGGKCQLLLLRYTQALITQISQTAAPTAGKTPRECHQGGRAPAKGRSDSLRPRPHHDPRPSGTGEGKL